MVLSPTKVTIATGILFMLDPDMTSANMKLFHAKMNDRMLAVAMPGADSGRVMRAKAPRGGRPSTSAASSNSIGIEPKNDIMMYRTSGKQTNIISTITTE